jgi:hypothetical protein
MQFQPRLFFKEALLFGLTLALGLYITYQHAAAFSGAELIQPTSVTAGDILWLLIVVGAVWFVSRIPRLASWIFWIFLSFLILAGSQVAFSVFLPSPWDILGS